MKTTIATLALTAAATTLLLTGCGSAGDDSDATPSASADSNSQACADYGSATAELQTLLTSDVADLGGLDEYQRRLDAVPNLFDKAELLADGDTAGRMAQTIDEFPDDLADLVLDADDYANNVQSVYNACKSGGHPVSEFTPVGQR